MCLADSAESVSVSPRVLIGLSQIVLEFDKLAGWMIGSNPFDG